MTYWHGGQRGLKVGAYLLPPCETGAKATSDYAAEFPGGHVMRPDRVYVTTDREGAVMFAAMHPSGGTVYEVSPEGPLIEDPDCMEVGFSYECARARILSAKNVSGFMRSKIRRAMARA